MSANGRKFAIAKSAARAARGGCGGALLIATALYWFTSFGAEEWIGTLKLLSLTWFGLETAVLTMYGAANAVTKWAPKTPE